MAPSRPRHYQRLASQFPDYLNAVEALGKSCKASGPLPEKMIQLAQLSAAAAIRSEGAVHSHTKRALQSGATAQEIRHCLLTLTPTLGFPTVMAALCWADDLLNEKGEDE